MATTSREGARRAKALREKRKREPRREVFDEREDDDAYLRGDYDDAFYDSDEPPRGLRRTARMLDLIAMYNLIKWGVVGVVVLALPEAPEPGVVLLLLLVAVIGVGLLIVGALVSSRGLLRGEEESSRLGKVVLVVALLDFPLGTVAAIFGLDGLADPETKDFLRPLHPPRQLRTIVDRGRDG